MTVAVFILKGFSFGLTTSAVFWYAFIAIRYKNWLPFENSKESF